MDICLRCLLISNTSSITQCYCTCFCAYGLDQFILAEKLDFFRKLHRLNTYWHRRGVDGPKPNFIFGNALQLKQGFQYFDIENTHKYGPIFG